MDSLIVKLKLMGLRLRVGNGNEGSPLMAAKDEEDEENRVKLNRRGIVLESELTEGEAHNCA